MRIVCISDTHNQHRDLNIPKGDVLIHAGDATYQGLSHEVEDFLNWFACQPHPFKILVAGNHDWLFQRHPMMARQLLDAHMGVITYLQDSGCEIGGLKVWGSPWQPAFCDWAFNLPRKGQALREVWNRIPMDTDVLVTHGPAYGILDQVMHMPAGGWDSTLGEPDHLGCEELRIRIRTVKPRLHVFGHIHGGHGIHKDRWTTQVNASICDEGYRPVNAPVVLSLLKPKRRQ